MDMKHAVEPENLRIGKEGKSMRVTLLSHSWAVDPLKL